MTREEAIGVAVSALDYALENDWDYLSEEARAEWAEALTVMAALREERV